MRLIDYGAGEICDRISILSLKILFTPEGSNVTAFATERDKLLVQLKTKQLNGKCQEAIFDLAAVNSALWHAEDDLRKLREQSLAAHGGTVVQTAFRIQKLNDQRAELVGQINRDSGDGDHREKVHG